VRLAKNTEAWPLVYHGNGNSKNEKIFTELKKRMREGESWQERHPSEENITILTWSIPEEKTILEESFAKMGIEDGIHVIPISKPFNWLDKIKKTMEFLETVGTEYVMGVDATDVIISTDKEGQTKLWYQIKDTFRMMSNWNYEDNFATEKERRLKLGDGRAKLCYNAEKHNWPSSKGHGTNIEEDGMNGHLIKLLKETELFEERMYKDFMGSDSYRLNSGCFFGETEYTKLFYKTLWDKYVKKVYDKGTDESFFGGDQGFIRIMQKECFPEMFIDYKCKIFHTFTSVQMEDIDGIYE
jgi:hypothetical protein